MKSDGEQKKLFLSYLSI